MHSQNPTAEEVQTLREINQSMSKLMDTASTMLKSTFAKYEQEIADLHASLAEATPAPLQPVAAMLSAIDSLRATVAQAEADTKPRPLNLTIDGERLAAAVAPPMDKAKVDPIEALIKEWNLATSPRENGGWIAKGWRNGHCYSESRDTLAEAVDGLIAQIETDNRTLSAKGAGAAVACWAFDGAKNDTPTEWPDDLNQPAPVTDVEKVTTLAESVAPAKPWTGVIVVALPSVYLVECSLDVTGNSVRIFDPTPTAMQALTLACINAEREPVLVIDGKGLPAFARICKVECNHLVGLAPPQCTLTLMGGSVT